MRNHVLLVAPTFFKGINLKLVYSLSKFELCRLQHFGHKGTDR